MKELYLYPKLSNFIRQKHSNVNGKNKTAAVAAVVVLVVLVALAAAVAGGPLCTMAKTELLHPHR